MYGSSAKVGWSAHSTTPDAVTCQGAPLNKGLAEAYTIKEPEKDSGSAGRRIFDYFIVYNSRLSRRTRRRKRLKSAAMAISVIYRLGRGSE